MKMNESVASVYLEDYDIHVNTYLTYAQIQQIVNSTLSLGKMKAENGRLLNSWADRQQNIDMMVLLQATDITEADWNTPHSVFLQSGLIDAVKRHIFNYNQIEEAFKYQERWDKVVTEIADRVTDSLRDMGIKFDKEAITGANTEQ